MARKHGFKYDVFLPNHHCPVVIITWLTILDFCVDFSNFFYYLCDQQAQPRLDERSLDSSSVAAFACLTVWILWSRDVAGEF